MPHENTALSRLLSLSHACCFTFHPSARHPGSVLGQYTALAVVAGNPAISYYDVTNGYLNFLRASNSSGTTWPSSAATADTGFQSGDVGQYTSQVIVQGTTTVVPSDPPPSAGTFGVPVAHVSRLGATNIIEFKTTTGRRYRLWYSNNGALWAPSPVLAYSSGARTLWPDSGPPSTLSSPFLHPGRHYRVELVVP